MNWNEILCNNTGNNYYYWKLHGVWVMLCKVQMWVYLFNMNNWRQLTMYSSYHLPWNLMKILSNKIKTNRKQQNWNIMNEGWFIYEDIFNGDKYSNNWTQIFNIFSYHFSARFYTKNSSKFDSIILRRHTLRDVTLRYFNTFRAVF